MSSRGVFEDDAREGWSLIRSDARCRENRTVAGPKTLTKTAEGRTTKGADAAAGRVRKNGWPGRPLRARRCFRAAAKKFIARRAPARFSRWHTARPRALTRDPRARRRVTSRAAARGASTRDAHSRARDVHLVARRFARSGASSRGDVPRASRVGFVGRLRASSRVPIATNVSAATPTPASP